MNSLNNTPETGPDPTTMLSPDEAVQLLRAIHARVPVPDASRIPTGKANRLAQVDPHFVTASVNAIAAVDVVQTAVGRTGEEARQEVETAARWTAFTDELRTMLAASVQADRVRHQCVGLAALQTYSICKQLARDKTRAPKVAAHLQEMRRLNKLGRKARKTQTEPDPAPQLPVTTTE